MPVPATPAPCEPYSDIARAATLDAQKVATALGDKYLVTPQSVARHIAQIEEFAALATVGAKRGFTQ
jgi:hypothetical protein